MVSLMLVVMPMAPHLVHGAVKVALQVAHSMTANYD